jgi:hypothetical protein
MIYYIPSMFKVLICTNKEAKLMNWHKEERKNDVVMQRHLANACQWRATRVEFPNFGKDSHTKSIHSAT